MRKNIVVGNWKMNLTRENAIALVAGVLSDLPNNLTSVVFAPSHTYLYKVTKMCANIKNISVASQDCSIHQEGAYTGEVSASMIASCNVEYIILGHSERRKCFSESNSLLKIKVDRVLENNLSIIFCCGESLEQRKKELHFDWVKSQVVESLFHLSSKEFSNIVIAYEPIWAIGTGITATSEQAQEMHAFLRDLIAKKYGTDIASNISILYGGSCNPSNSLELFSQNDIDGGLIGGASLQADSFISIIDSF